MVEWLISLQIHALVFSVKFTIRTYMCWRDEKGWTTGKSPSFPRRFVFEFYLRVEDLSNQMIYSRWVGLLAP